MSIISVRRWRSRHSFASVLSVRRTQRKLEEEGGGKESRARELASGAARRFPWCLPKPLLSPAAVNNLGRRRVRASMSRKRSAHCHCGHQHHHNQDHQNDLFFCPANRYTDTTQRVCVSVVSEDLGSGLSLGLANLQMLETRARHMQAQT